MAERDLVERAHIAMGLDALDAAAQGRKRAYACAGHAPSKFVRFDDKIMRLSQKGSARSDAKPHTLLSAHAPSPEVLGRFVQGENQKLAHLFMVCSNIKLTGPQESIELGGHKIHERNQMRCIRLCSDQPSWPGLSRPSTVFAARKDVEARA